MVVDVATLNKRSTSRTGNILIGLAFVSSFASVFLGMTNVKVCVSHYLISGIHTFCNC